MMKVVTVLLIFFCGFMSYDIYYGHNGIKQAEGIKKQLLLQEKDSLARQKANQEVALQINDLKQGPIAIEELARSELGLIKPNERFYRVLATDEQLQKRPLNFY